ncbi:MAG TPA: hypothetical protein VF266_10540 [Thermoanaerobaculia bacterium]
MNLVTVTAYPERDTARTAKQVLDVAGIESVVDEPSERRVRLRVENVDALRAGDALNRNGDTLPEIQEADEETVENLCPACDSPDAEPSRRARSFLLVTVLAIAIGTAAGFLQATFFAIPAAAVFHLVQGRWRCNACGETWD